MGLQYCVPLSQRRLCRPLARQLLGATACANVRVSLHAGVLYVGGDGPPVPPVDLVAWALSLVLHALLLSIHFKFPDALRFASTPAARGHPGQCQDHVRRPSKAQRPGAGQPRRWRQRRPGSPSARNRRCRSPSRPRAVTSLQAQSRRMQELEAQQQSACWRLAKAAQRPWPRQAKQCRARFAGR